MKFNFWSEYRYRVLWYFVAFVFGVALYFGLPKEPNWIMCVVLTCCLAGASFFRKRVWIKLALFFVLGITVACVRTHFVHTELMWKSQWNKEISGQVVEVFSTHKGQMLELENIDVKGAKFVPKKIRIVYQKQEPRFHEGDKIIFTGTLYAPSVHQVRRFFYQGISAQGKLNKLLSYQQAPEQTLGYVRQSIMDRLRTHLKPAQAEIAIPLIVGEQGVVSVSTYELYRKSGIAHVLSVSGFHMMLLAMFVFFLIRGFLALFPYVALRVPTKKIAAVIAFLVTGCYLMISGMQVPAIRSFMMISLVFLAVLVERKSVSLHAVCLAAFCLLFVRPEWVASVSFQLSFIAVIVLVGIFEDVSKLLPKGLFFRLVVTAVVANIFVTLALAPFVVYHFNQFNPYGVVGNLLTSILFSFFIMPLLFVSVVLMPFHWEGPILKLAGFMLDQVGILAKMVASWPGSEIILPSFSEWGLGLIAFGIVTLCILKTKYRLVGFVFVIAGLILGYGFRDKPDLIVGDKALILIRSNDGAFSVKGEVKSWSAQKWLRRNGQVSADPWTSEEFSRNGHRIVFSVDQCAGADLAILKKKDLRCHAKDVLVSKYQRNYKIYLKDSIVIQRDGWEDYNRPWGFNFKGKYVNKRKEKNEK